MIMARIQFQSLQSLLEKVWSDNDLPGYPVIEHDNDGQIIIYTGMTEKDKKGNLRPMTGMGFTQET